MCVWGGGGGGGDGPISVFKGNRGYTAIFLLQLPSCHCCPWCHNGLFHGFWTRALGTRTDKA